MARRAPINQGHFAGVMPELPDDPFGMPTIKRMLQFPAERKAADVLACTTEVAHTRFTTPIASTATSAVARQHIAAAAAPVL